MIRDLTSIDALLAAPKTFLGTPRWQEDDNAANLTVSIVLEGAVVGDFRLTASTPFRTAAQRGDAT